MAKYIKFWRKDNNLSENVELIFTQFNVVYLKNITNKLIVIWYSDIDESLRSIDLNSYNRCQLWQNKSNFKDTIIICLK